MAAGGVSQRWFSGTVLQWKNVPVDWREKGKQFRGQTTPELLISFDGGAEKVGGIWVPFNEDVRLLAE